MQLGSLRVTRIGTRHSSSFSPGVNVNDETLVLNILGLIVFGTEQRKPFPGAGASRELIRQEPGRSQGATQPKGTESVVGYKSCAVPTSRAVWEIGLRIILLGDGFRKSVRRCIPSVNMPHGQVFIGLNLSGDLTVTLSTRAESITVLYYGGKTSHSGKFYWTDINQTRNRPDLMYTIRSIAWVVIKRSCRGLMRSGSF